MLNKLILTYEAYYQVQEFLKIDEQVVDIDTIKANKDLDRPDFSHKNSSHSLIPMDILGSKLESSCVKQGVPGALTFTVQEPVKCSSFIRSLPDFARIPK